MDQSKQPATLEALRRCALKCANAGDGRGRAGAIREARNALQHAGHDARAALQMAESMARIGDGVQRVVSRAALDMVAP